MKKQRRWKLQVIQSYSFYKIKSRMILKVFKNKLKRFSKINNHSRNKSKKNNKLDKSKLNKL